MARRRRLSLGLVGAAVFGLLGCAASIDPTAPVLLVPEGFTSAELDQVQDAAEDWNMHFGTQIAVDRTGHGRAAQRVPVYFSRFACAYVTGLTQRVDGTEVAVCDRRPDDLTMVMRHELGHVLNIGTHARDERAVMAHGWCFAPEDVLLFEQANGALVDRPGCQQARRPLGSTPLVRADLLGDGASTVMLAQRGQALELLTLDPRDARPLGSRVQLAGGTAGTAFARALTQDLLLLHVVPPEGAESHRWYDRATGALLGQTNDGITGIAVHEGAIYGLLAAKGGSRLARLGRDGWQRLPSIGTLARMSVLVSSGEVLFALETLPGLLRVRRFDKSGFQSQRDYALPANWLPVSGPVAAGGGALYVAPIFVSSFEPATEFDLLRIDVRMGLGAMHQLGLRLGPLTLQQPRPIWAGERLWLASDRGPALLPLDPQTLQPGRWQLLGQACIGGGGIEATVATEQGLLGIWLDEAHVAWTRCLPR